MNFCFLVKALTKLCIYSGYMGAVHAVDYLFTYVHYLQTCGQWSNIADELVALVLQKSNFLFYL